MTRDARDVCVTSSVHVGGKSTELESLWLADGLYLRLMSPAEDSFVKLSKCHLKKHFWVQNHGWPAGAGLKNGHEKIHNLYHEIWNT